MSDDFRIKLSTELDSDVGKNTQKQLDKIDNLSVTIDDIKISSQAANSLKKQLGNQSVSINVDLGKSDNLQKQAQQLGTQISQALNKGLKSFSDLKIGTGNISAILDKDGLVDVEASLRRIKEIYSEFGQVKITNQIFDSDGELQKFKVNIEQVNGDLKETRSFLMELNGNAFTFPDDVIKGSESYVKHLNSAKNSTNELQTEEEKLANTMADVREKTELARQSEEKSQQLAQKNAINKALEQEYLQREKLLASVQASIDTGKYQAQIDQLEANFQKYGLSAEQAAEKVSGLQTALNSLTSGNLNKEQIVSVATELEQGMKSATNQIKQARIEFNKFATPDQINSLRNRIQEFMTKNTAITKNAKAELSSYLEELKGENISVDRWKQINNSWAETQNNMRLLGKLGKSVKDQFSEAFQSFTQWISVTSLIMGTVHQFTQSIGELKEIDDILTEISKTSDMTRQELQELGSTSFASASELGKTATDYLTSVQEMSRSGFYGEQGEEMAKTSLLAQAAGDMTADLANKFLLATNAAYKYEGDAQKLNAVLDGMNSITNRNSVSMVDMAEAMSEAGTVAANYRVSIEDVSAMIGTMEAVTKSGGSEVGNSLKSILINLQNITSSKIVDTLDAANASMTEMVNGVEQLRDPISILRDLSATFTQLDEADPLRAEILTNIGGRQICLVI